MKTVARSLLLIGVATLGLAGSIEAGMLPRLDSFYAEVETLVRKYYPEAAISRAEDKLTFSHETMEFMIHTALKTGEWQEARQVEGPKRHGGIAGKIELQEGRWQGAAMVPQYFNEHYFTTYLMAPYSERCGCHLVAYLHYPDTVDPEFVKAWANLVNDFEKYLVWKE